MEKPIPLMPEHKEWDDLPLMKGTSDDKIALVVQWTLSGLSMALPFIGIFCSGRKRRRLFAASMWLSLCSFTLSLSQEGALERFILNHRSAKKYNEEKTTLK